MLALVIPSVILLYVATVCEGIPRVVVPPGSIPGTRILKIPALPPLYTGDNVTEFLNLCPNGCARDCPLIYQPDWDKSPPAECTDEDKAILEDLEKAKEKVRAFLQRLENEEFEILSLYLVLGIIILMGGYLVHKKHFHYRTLYDSDYPDPADGMPLWQYMRMKFAPTTVPDQRPKHVIQQERFEQNRQKFIEEEVLNRMQLRLQEEKLHRTLLVPSAEVLFADQTNRDVKGSRRTAVYKPSNVHAFDTTQEKAVLRAAARASVAGHLARQINNEPASPETAQNKDRK